MASRVGDTTFLRDATPGFISNRNAKTGKVAIRSDQAEVSRHLRHGYINGISKVDRGKLYDILDQAKSQDSILDRIGLLRDKLTELEKDPKNTDLSRYLKAEMMHMMNTFNVKPREYIVDESKIR